MYVYNVKEYGQEKSISDGYGSIKSDDNDSEHGAERDAESIAETESESRWKPGTEPVTC